MSSHNRRDSDIENSSNDHETKKEREFEIKRFDGSDKDFDKSLGGLALFNYPIVFLALYNFEYTRKWSKLTSPPHDRQIFESFCETFGLPLLVFTNLSGEQIKSLFRKVSKLLDKNTGISLLFHYSGHGCLMKKIVTWKQVIVGVDDGCVAVASFCNRVGCEKTDKIMILDCCREFYDEVETRGQGLVKPGKTLYVYTALSGKTAVAKKGEASNLSKSMDNLSNLLITKYKGDLVAWLDFCVDNINKDSGTWIAETTGDRKFKMKIENFRKHEGVGDILRENG
eukprot:UN29911